MSNKGSHRVIASIFTGLGGLLIAIELIGVALSLRYGSVPLGIIEFLFLGIVLLIIGLVLFYYNNKNR